MSTEKIRESVIAGSWYPDHPETLTNEIRAYLNNAKIEAMDGELLGLISPHAGYMYSGGVAAHGYKLLERFSFDRVLIVAPSHRAHFKGASIYHLGGYRTPLGVVSLDEEIVHALRQASPLIGYVPQADSLEHSLEIQLPFLQVVLGDFRLTPVIMGDQSFDLCTQLASLIAEACRGRKVLLIASTDLSHYHSDSEARRLDRIVTDHVAAFDADGLLRDLKAGKCEACGGGPVATILMAARSLGGDDVKILHYANSGDVTGESREVVGYLSAAIYRKATSSMSENAGNAKKKVGVDLGLSEEEKETLKQIAYEAIRSRCLGHPLPAVPVGTAKLSELRGAFVCLKKRGELRGCIGMIEGRNPLHETIRTMAVQAAFADPRFCALNSDELSEIALELSVLTPLERIHDPSEIEIGTHGLLIRKNHFSGLLLPQVATEQGWDRMQFVEWTCRKAGLPPDAWKDPEAELFRFSADVF